MSTRTSGQRRSSPSLARKSAPKGLQTNSKRGASSKRAKHRGDNEILGNQSWKSEVLRQAILATAAKMFIERGIGGTSIQDIAGSLNLTRTAIYYYFKKKDDILRALSEKVTISAQRLGGTAASRATADPIIALRDLVSAYAKLILSNPEGFRVLDRNEVDLVQEHLNVALKARRSVLDSFRTVIERGIQTGHFRNVDPSVAAFSLIGMCNWTAWWFKSGGRLSICEVAEVVADLATHAMQRCASRIPKTPDIYEAFRLLHEDLAFLERQLLKKS